MNRLLFNAQAAQYATPEVSGNGLVSWDGGKKCVIPSVKLYGAAVQDGTPTPDAPVMPVCNNGVFVSRGINLFSGFVKGVGINSASGAESASTKAAASDYIPVDFAAHPSYKVTGLVDTLFSFIAAYNQNHEFLGRTSGAGRTSITLKSNSFANSATEAAGDIAYIRITQYTVGTTGTIDDIASAKTMLCADADDKPYTPYYDGGQAQAPELWAIPRTDIRDEWDPQTGKGIRRCAVIDSYAGEAIDTPYISSTGELSDGAYVVYGIPDTPFTSPPAKLTQPTGFGQIIQTGGDIPDCPITAKYLTHK